MGDLAGITEKLDYVQETGFNGFWVTPFYPSPWKDGGYDISNYTDVDPRFGTLQDFDEMVKTAHSRNLKVFIDLVPNHSSDQHPWFQQSRASDPQYADYYVWRDEIPNNWQAHFPIWERDEATGGFIHKPRSAWTFDHQRNAYRLNSFSPEQPDLNWENPQVRKEFADIMRFWLERGVDGFRVDVVDHIGKHPDLLDEDPNPHYVSGQGWPRDALLNRNSCNYPSAVTYIKEMADVLAEYEARDGRPRTIVAEAHVPMEDYANYWIGNRVMPFNFQSVYERPWNARSYQKTYEDYHNLVPLGAMPTHVLGNHDEPRLVDRIMAATHTSPREARRAARSLAMVQMTLPGITYTYMGDELGAQNAEIPEHKINDSYLRRDPQRATMPWRTGPTGGFTTAKEGWLPPIPFGSYTSIRAQQSNKSSHLAYYRKLLSLRASHSALSRAGVFIPMTAYYRGDRPHKDILVFGRATCQNETVTIMNFSKEDREVRLERNIGDSLLLLSGLDQKLEIHPKRPDTVRLKGFQSAIIQTK